MAWSGKGRFQDLVQHDSKVRQWLSEEEIDACFELKPYLRNIDKIYRKCGL